MRRPRAHPSDKHARAHFSKTLDNKEPRRPMPETTCSSAAPCSARPNVVMIIVDDMNDYGFYGVHPLVKIPHLSRFKRSALTFRRAYCASPVCSPFLAFSTPCWSFSP